ncbi:MAG: hypothetical protein Q9225_006227 [Loekoesia sp. 1 TL-2023]
MGRSRRPLQMPRLMALALRTAVEQDSSGIVRFLLDSSIPVEPKGMSQAFDTACRLGHQPALLSLIENDTHKRIGLQEYQKGLETAAIHGHHELVRFLLAGYLANHDLWISEELFIKACGNGFVDVVRLLHQAIKGSLFDTFLIDRALNVSCSNGHEEVTAFLVSEGADVNAVVEEASSMQQVDDFENVFYSWTEKSSALQAALRGFGRFTQGQPRSWSRESESEEWRKADAAGQEATIQLLINMGADIHALGGLRERPLHTAVNNCSARVVESLVLRGSNVNASPVFSKALLQAAANRELEAGSIMKKLLEAGAILPDSTGDDHPVLDNALAFFDPEAPAQSMRHSDNGYPQLETVEDVLHDGPGAVVKLILPRLPEAKADKLEFGLLLQMAAVAGDVECVKLLLQREVDVNAVGFHYGTALQAASRHGNIDIVDILLGAGADVDIFGGAHGTALNAASRSGNVDIVRLLVRANANVNTLHDGYKMCDTALRTAVQENHSAIAHMLIQHGADVDLCGNYDDVSQSILYLTLKSKNDTLLESLLAAGAEVNASFRRPRYYWSIPDGEASPLHMACMEGHESGVRLLLAYGAEVDRSIKQQFNIRRLRSKAKMARYKRRVEFTKRPLQVAAYQGHLSIVRLLIEAGADIDYYDNMSGHTALSLASSAGHMKIVEELVEAGASIFSSMPMVNSLAAACDKRRRPIIEFLLEELSGTEAEESACAEAMSAMRASECHEMIQLLLDHGVPWPPETDPRVTVKPKACTRCCLNNGFFPSEDDDEGEDNDDASQNDEDASEASGDDSSESDLFKIW